MCCLSLTAWSWSRSLRSLTLFLFAVFITNSAALRTAAIRFFFLSLFFSLPYLILFCHVCMQPGLALAAPLDMLFVPLAREIWRRKPSEILASARPLSPPPAAAVSPLCCCLHLASLLLIRLALAHRPPALCSSLGLYMYLVACTHAGH